MPESPGTFIELGQRIADRRREMGLSISDVSDRTKIRAHFLEAIESGDAKSLPGTVYSKGFIKKYLEVIGLPELLDEYIMSLESISSRKKGDVMVQYFPAQKGFQKGSRIWIFAFLFFAIGISLYMIWQQKEIFNTQTANSTAISKKAATETVEEPAGNKDLPEKAATEAEESPSADTAAPAVAEEPAVAADDTSWIPGHDEATVQSEQPSKTGLLVIRVSGGSCWIRISRDDGKTVQKTLFSGESEETLVDVRTSVRFGNAGAVKLSWGDEDIGSIGRPGEVVTWNFFPDGSMKRQ